MSGILAPARGIRLLRLPLPFELEHVHAGLVQLEDGYLLIDTGMAGERSFETLTAALAEAGAGWREIRTVVATHMHPDHIGGAPRVLAASGARLWIHRAEFEHLNSVLSGDTPWVEAALREAGVPDAVVGEIHSAIGGMRGTLGALHPDRQLEGGETLATAMGRMQVIATPGHSCGHICLYWPEEKVLYAGDHMIGSITPNIAWMPGRDMLGEYLDSLALIEALDVDLVISSHGEPFGNHRQWIAAARRHHEERCAAILELIPRSVYEMLPVLWNRELSPFHLYFAVFEVLAHVEHLRRLGHRLDGTRAHSSGENQ